MAPHQECCLGTTQSARAWQAAAQPSCEGATTPCDVKSSISAAASKKK
ncbi:TPA: hypothetical protein HA251_04760 [Candidatus Woesearchaeota archaeon]|nr:hypothetical protein [Candidatus Woesearchaeota archaeon]